MNMQKYKQPEKDNRIFRILHGIPENYGNYIDSNIDIGFGGFVVNASWHDSPEDNGKKYLCEKEDFENLAERIQIIKDKNCGLWLYDEKGYPSASADGLTLKDHPEYEAMGFTLLHVEDEVYHLDEKFDKIIYACGADGTKADFTERTAYGARNVYAVKPVFEGSHAQKCGWGPRRYPNIMNPDASAAFIKCTYDKYYAELHNFSEFEAVFTDEPSLMSAYVNCDEEMPYAFLPWEESLPAKFREMHGVDFYAIINELFDVSGVFKTGKLMFWETVAEMVNQAYFVQIGDWCKKHGLAFSGHCLLEECISRHVPLYGNLIKCLKSFDYPGVDMLTGSPEAFKYDDELRYVMAAKYVGSAARMMGKTERVMVEICPIPAYNNGEDYTLEEEIGTMDLLFLCGMNHINSYLTPERLGEDFRLYADYFARAAYVLRESRWVGEIGMYYPIEAMQGCYVPSKTGINTGAKLSEPNKLIEESISELHKDIWKAHLDYTVIDGEWIVNAEIVKGKLSCNKLEISCIVVPCVNYVPADVLAKLNAFEKSNGKVIWAKAKPEGVNKNIAEDVVSELKKTVDYGIELRCDAVADIFVSPLIRDGKRIWYVINSSDKENTVSIKASGGSAFQIWHNRNGEIANESSIKLSPYTSVFVCEE